MKIVFLNFVFSILIYEVLSAPQQNPEINDQFEQFNTTESKKVREYKTANHTDVQKTVKNIETQRRSKETPEFHSEKHAEIDRKTVSDDIIAENTDTTDLEELTLDDVSNITTPKPTFMTKVYKIITGPLVKFISAPKVVTVVKNIGTCIVNGAMELVSFYFPAPLIPLIASAAGMVIPFEPVVMLRKKMPVTSYRRAFKTAVNGFLGTFDRYKNEEDDPYMTRRFNRRFLGDSKEKDRF